MAYTYKLETLLTYRQNLEEQAQQKLGREQNILLRHIERLEKLRSEKIDMIQRFEDQKKKKMMAPLFSFFMEGIRNKEVEIEIQINTIESQKQVVEKARIALLEKVKGRKIIEKAKEKDYQSYLREYMRREQNENDEQAVLRFGRNDT